MKDCKKIHPLLPVYIEGQLSPGEKSQVDKHLGSCETARAELERFRHLLEGLGNLPEPQVPADLHRKIMAKLGQQPQSITPRQHFWGPQIWGLAAAVVMVFVLFNQYPNWKETWKVNKPEASTNSPVPAQPGSVGGLGLNKKAQTGMNSNLGVQQYAPAREKNLKEEAKTKDYSAPAQSETTDITPQLSMPSETKADNFSEPDSALLKRRSAKKTLQKPQAMLASGAAAPAPMAAVPPAPAPTVPSLDQSMRSLTYSQEQTVVTWNGNNGPSTVESQELVTDAETFQKYWQIPHPGEAPPEVDFTKNAVVILNAGEKPSAGYSVQVTRLEEKTGQLVIHYKVDAPAPDAVAAAIITHPWVLQVIPKPSKPVVYLKDP